MLTKSEVKQIPCRIRKRYFNLIRNEEKPIEYRKNSSYWQKRLLGMSAEDYASVMGFADATFPFKEKPTQPLVLVFLCGKDIHRREVVLIERMKTPDWFSSQGKKDVDTETCFALHLGREIKWCQCACGCDSSIQNLMEDRCDYCNQFHDFNTPT